MIRVPQRRAAHYRHAVVVRDSEHLLSGGGIRRERLVYEGRLAESRDALKQLAMHAPIDGGDADQIRLLRDRFRRIEYLHAMLLAKLLREPFDAPDAQLQ